MGGGGGGRATTHGPNATAVRTCKRARCHVPSCALYPSQNIKRRDPPRPGCRATFVLLTPRAQPAARGRSGAGRPWGDRGVDVCSPHPARGSRSSRSSFFFLHGKKKHCQRMTCFSRVRFTREQTPSPAHAHAWSTGVRSRARRWRTARRSIREQMLPDPPATWEAFRHWLRV